MQPVAVIKLLVTVVVATLAAAFSAQALAATKTVRYGPYTIPAGTMDAPGVIHNEWSYAVERPCFDCYITSFAPDLVYPDGTRATMETGAMLHHFVLRSQFRSDATCGNDPGGPVGERVFASGDERTVMRFPSDYGYRVRPTDSWNLLIDLMNHSTSEQTVYVQVTYTTRPASASLKRLRPVWLDIDQCGDSEYSIPAGFSDTTRDWEVNVPGEVVAAAGHVHGHGVEVEATTGGKSICKSVATPDPMSDHNILSMSVCRGDPLARVRSGQTVRLHSRYRSPDPADDVMGIMIMWVHPT